MKKLLSLLFFFGALMFVMSCGDDDDDDDAEPSFSAPTVTAPGAVTSVDNGATGASVSFIVSVDAGLTATYTATGSGVTVSNPSGDVSGTSVSINFDAGTTEGAASVTLTVTDSEGQSASATAVINILGVDDNAISISSIPATATIDFGADLADVPYQVDGADGIASFEASVNGGAAVDFAAVTGDDLSTNPTSINGTFTLGWQTILDLGGVVGANTIVFTATDADGDTDEFTHVLTVNAAPVTPVVEVRGDITENTTWTADNIYVLETRVTVLDGVTLTIEAGTVIKGEEGQGSASTALLVARGGTLNANGTSALPIIFTSILDPIDPADVAAGLYASTTSPEQPGLWGGVLILGRAPISAQNDNDEDLTEVQIEGIPSTDPNGLYGGDDPADNSGTITYISIRHGGTNIGAGNEINGLTLGGVGSGTTINNVEVVANADDGIEWFGGNVTVNNALIWNSNDDSMDTDQDWIGECNNFIIVTPKGGSAFELDGPEGSLNRGTHQFDNGVVFAGADIDHIADWDDNTNAGISNTYFFGITVGDFETFGGDGTGVNTGLETDVASDNAAFAGVPAENVTFGVAVGSQTVGPTASDFDWTWAGNSGALSDLGL